MKTPLFILLLATQGIWASNLNIKIQDGANITTSNSPSSTAWSSLTCTQETQVNKTITITMGTAVNYQTVGTRITGTIHASKKIGESDGVPIISSKEAKINEVLRADTPVEIKTTAGAVTLTWRE